MSLNASAFVGGRFSTVNKKFSFGYTLLLVVIQATLSSSTFAQAAFNAPSDSDAKASIREDTSNAIDLGDRKFLVVSYEWAYTDKKYEKLHNQTSSKNTDGGRWWPEIVRNQEELNALREKLSTIAPGAYRLVGRGNMLLVQSTGKYPAGDVRHVNSLNIPISLTLSNTTVWEALKQFNITVNRHPENRQPMKLEWVFITSLSPKIIFEKELISLDMHEQPARDVLCEIFRQSPLFPSYEYRFRYGRVNDNRYPIATLVVHPHNDAGQRIQLEKNGDLYQMPAMAGYEVIPSGSAEDQKKFRKEHFEANKRFYDYFKRLRSESKDDGGNG